MEVVGTRVIRVETMQTIGSTKENTTAQKETKGKDKGKNQTDETTKGRSTELTEITRSIATDMTTREGKGARKTVSKVRSNNGDQEDRKITSEERRRTADYKIPPAPQKMNQQYCTSRGCK